MPFTVHQWPASLQRKEIDALPMGARTAVLVMLRAMERDGPHPEAFQTKPLGRHLQGISQANLKIQKEQIRVLYTVYGTRIVLLSVFKKTSPQLEQREYDAALNRKKTVDSIIASHGDVPLVH